MTQRANRDQPLRPLLEELVSLWRTPVQRRRLLTITLSVATAVSFGHLLLDPYLPIEAWIVLHALLPALVFGAGAHSAGTQLVDRQLLLRGAVVVVVVACSFTLINNYLTLPIAAQIALNLLVPAAVSTLGALGATRAAGEIEVAEL